MRRIVERINRYLEILKNADGEKSASEIARITGIRPATVLEYLLDLEELGWIKREVKKGMPPRVVAVLTEKGKCVLECLSQ